MAQNLVTKNYRNDNANRFIEDIGNPNNSLYLFAGEPDPWFAGIIPQPYDDTQITVIEPYRSMLFGKQITPQNVMLMHPNYQYQYNTVYAMYDDADPLIWTKQFYATVNAGAFSHTFKCLDNNNGVPSTVQPNFSDVDAMDDAYMTSDGYTWKYLCSVDSSTISSFATPNWFPCGANASVENAAIPGSIDVIQTLSGGNGYSNYLTGVFSISDIRLNSNDYVYAVNAYASPLQHFYDGCVIYITSDVLGDSAGQFRTIVSYLVNSSCNFIELDTPFVNVPQNGAQYTIYPGISIVGDGTETDTAVAWAVVNASTNSIASAQVLYRGGGYKYATANVYAATVVGVGSNATLRPIYSPPGGHGANIDQELGATAVGISVVFNETEGNTIFANCDYQRIGLIKNPTFSNVQVNFSSVSSIFVGGETVLDVGIIALQAVGQISANSNLLLASNSDFTNQLNVDNDVVYTDGTNYQFNTVAGIINSTAIELANNATWTTNALTVYLANVLSSSVLTGSGFNYVNLDQVNAPISVGDYLIGEVSGSFGIVGSVYRSGQQKTFSTFLATWQYFGSLLSGTFQNNESVQKNLVENTANADLASVASNNSVLYVSNTFGIMNIGDRLTGNISGATFQVTSIWPPEINFESGSILYLENFSAVSRNLTRSEQYQLVLTF
jgi:hypothetical protein